MATKTKKAKISKSTSDFNPAHAVVLEIIRLMDEQEILPWECPYIRHAPSNAVSGWQYRGQNFFEMMFMGMLAQYPFQKWAGVKQFEQFVDAHPEAWADPAVRPTIQQWAKYTDKEGKERSRSTGLPILSPILKRAPKRDKQGNVIYTIAPGVSSEHPQGVPEWVKWTSYRYVHVWNIAQAEGFDQEALHGIFGYRNDNITEQAEKADHALRQAAARLKLVIVDNAPDTPCYIPTADKVHMPNRKSFISDGEYLNALAHEITHATGHHSRLNRDLTGNNMTSRYADEEVVAEMAAMMILATFGIANSRIVENGAAYVAFWKERMSKNLDLFGELVNRAQKAFDLIMGTSDEEMEGEGE